MIPIRATMSNDRDFNNFFKSLKWTEGIKYRRPNLLNDECAKIILADKKETKFLRHLLSAILSIKIENIKIIDVAMSKKYKNDRTVYLDILTEIENKIVNIEIQLLYQKFYDLRCFWHLSNIFTNNVNDIYHNFKKQNLKKVKHDDFLKKAPNVISINICGFNIDEADPNYFWNFGLVDKIRLNRSMAEEISFYYIELPKFKKQFHNKDINELETLLEKWLYFFVLCDTKEKLTAFLEYTGTQQIFSEYETKIEEVSRMLDFATLYENSLYNTIEFMTPAEEFECYKKEMEDYKKEMEDYKKEMEKYKNKIEFENRNDKLELAAKDKEIERLRKELEKLNDRE